MSVSFGKNIPIARCQIKDLKQEKFIPATLYELDCSDKNDITEVESVFGTWNFRNTILKEMHNKYNAKQKGSKRFQDSAFFVMKNNNGEIVGITQTSQSRKNINIELIESENEGKYKYVGQTMLAALTKAMKHIKADTLLVRLYMPQAYEFYTRKCGFKPYGYSWALYMDKPEMEKLQKKTEYKTHSQIIDLKV